jgi:thiol-disulfide isomerase/thioredoxin
MTRISATTLAGGLCLAAAVAGFVFARWQHGAGAVDRPTAATLTAAIRATGIVGAARPDFSLPDLDGVMHNVAEWDGKVVAINFWATWCPPCRKEIPEFVALQRKYAGRGLQFVGVALEQPDPVRPFAAEHQMNYPILVGEMEVIQVAESYGNLIGALPYTVLVGRDGKIAFAHAGPLSKEQAEAALSPLL